MKEGYFSYRDLAAYQRAKELVVSVYKILPQFPKEENYALCDQLRRSAISVPSNIAEGIGRVSVKEQVHFLEIAYGSLCEMMCQLELARELNYITDEQLTQMENLAKDIIKPLSGLRAMRLSKLQ